MSGSTPKTYRGIVRGQTIVLDEDPGLPDGTQVFVVIEQLSTANAAAISDEDRAILEHVYQERGCGVEREC